MNVRTRFAPSPTGYLHIGGARTALYSWLFARHHGGQFILRIEDTDLERSTQESVDAILAGMEWLKLNYDEGPFFQTKRFDRYLQIAQQLLDEGKAYRCYCSKERLEKLREEQMAKKQKPRYDGHCRELNLPANEKPFVIRFRNPHEEQVVFTDQVFGHMVFQMDELDDLIIVRSDGSPTYNFTVVVDDYDMKITHVIRGDDHLNNTPRQITILKALGAPIPIYAHLPMILGPDGKRFSKRHGAVSVMQYREEGYLPEALLNYLVRLGWSHGDQEIFSREEMIKFFNLAHVQKSPAAFNPEKLMWVNQHYIKHRSIDDLAKELAFQFDLLDVDYQTGPALTEVVHLQLERAKTLKEMAERSIFFFKSIEAYDKDALKQLVPESLSVLQELHARLQALPTWDAPTIHAVIHAVVETLNIKMGKVGQPLRAAITGGTVSPPLDTTMALLGKSTSLSRLEQAMAFIKQSS